MHRVLVAVDGSENSGRAVRYAIALSRRVVSIEFVVVNVQPSVRPDPRLRSIVTPAMIAEYQEEQWEAATASARTLLDEAGARYSVEREAGPIVQTILRLVRERGCQQIIMGTRGADAVATLVVGSVARQVVALAPVPVTLVK